MRLDFGFRSRSAVMFAACAVGALVGLGDAGLAQTTLAKSAPKGETKSDVLSTSKRSQETAGDWMVECFEGADKRKTCVLSQSLSNAKTKQVLASWSVAKDTTGKTISTLRAPTGVQLAAGTEVTVEGQKSFAAPFLTCINVGCLATFELTSVLADQVGKAKKVTVGIEDLNKRKINFVFSTRGFDKAYGIFLQQAK